MSLIVLKNQVNSTILVMMYHQIEFLVNLYLLIYSTAKTAANNPPINDTFVIVFEIFSVAFPGLIQVQNLLIYVGFCHSSGLNVICV